MCQKDVARLGKVQTKATKMIPEQEAAPLGRAGRLVFDWLWEKNTEERPYFHVPVFKGGHRRWRFPFYKESDGKDERKCYKALLGRFWVDVRGKCFPMRTVSSGITGITSPGKQWTLLYCTILRCSWTGCWAIFSRPHFCQKGCTKWSLRSLPTWRYSMIPWQ